MIKPLKRFKYGTFDFNIKTGTNKYYLYENLYYWFGLDNGLEHGTDIEDSFEYIKTSKLVIEHYSVKLLTYMFHNLYPNIEVTDGCCTNVLDPFLRDFCHKTSIYKNNWNFNLSLNQLEELFGELVEDPVSFKLKYS